jgi:polysaccharide pyruvyl transferase CsaB
MERVPQRILLVGYIGFGNAGDEAIAQVAIGHLRERVPDAELTVISGDPPRTAELYGVRAIWWRDPLAIADAVRTTDLTILGGGGLFQDYWGFDPTTILTREHWGLSFYLAPALLSAVYGKPLMLYAVGAGPLLSDHGRTYTKVAGDIAARITVRDQMSKDLFESLGVAPGKITITADPAFDLTPEPAPDVPEVREWKSAGPAIAVCLRTWNFGSDSTFSDREVARALDDVLANEGGRILFVPFAGGDDIYVARRVLKDMKQRERAVVLEQPCSPNALAGIVGSAGLVLGMRLHSVIFSIAAQTPVVALEYDPKLAGLAALTGLEDFTLPFGGVEWDVLSRRLRQALHEKDRFRAMTAPLAASLRERARENADLAAEVLRRGSQTVDYGSDARTLVGRLVIAQVTGSENLIGRFQQCAEAMSHPVGEMRPIEMADSVVKKVEESQTRIRELEGLQTQWTDCRREVDRLKRELQQSADAAAELERRLAPHESKTFGGIVKRALQAALDLGQLLTPRPLRNALRKSYLNWFYFRVYPERRP